MREKDACWEYGDKLDGNRVRCRFCQKVINGGISRFKFHLSQIPSKGVNPCVKVTDDVREKVIALIEAKESHRELELLKRKRVAELSVLPKRTRELPSQPSSPGLPASPAIIPAFEPNQLLGLEVPAPVLRLSSAVTKPRPASGLEVERCIAEFFFENKLDYSIADSISYRHMMETLVGQESQGPSADVLRTKWLQKLKSEILQRTQEIKKDWVTTGCTILADSWTDNKMKALINFSVSSPLGTFFLKTIDASPHIKNHRGMYELFDEVIQEVGPDNVVQIISDRNINYGNIDKLIMQNYNTIFWSPCASFCVNSMLDEFSKIDWVNQCICQAQTITRFVYNNNWILDLMRRCMAGQELVCSGITKSVSDFLTLQSLLKHRLKLKQMFHSSDYVSSSYANRSLSISCVEILNDDEFWRAVEEIAAVSEPLLRVMRDVSGGKAAIGYIYESMTKVMDSIRTYYIMDEGKCKSFLDIVEQKWQVELHSHLHSAAAFLNPSIQYNPEVKFFTSIKEEFYHVLDKVLTAPDQRHGITSELHAFRKAQGMFASNIAKEARNNTSPGMWWEQYGDSAPALQHCAVRIVSQVCSTLTFQRDWSIILQSHSEKRNKLNKEALADQAFVHYNLMLHSDSKTTTKKKGEGDPIALDDIDMTSPWVEDSDGPSLTQWLDRFPSALDGGDLNTRQFGGSIFGTNDLFGL
ncbi:uncharacterized protein LOC123443193 [Hordeum vulgare subsp. vulgare]|uniref:uncharacterized protein LOC123443193 n=1 Tax=Hordeum vulgare subsp. vulgare TaxID=112509 RepID=UPI0002959CD7|nr:uncharacterized protein LOC123443193 [Hordeum vulgare subsp. vulgare]XP_044975426.1 uncharacterized protein LOC123443193 [Hordeum vulgare subsp. vulgare]